MRRRATILLPGVLALAACQRHPPAGAEAAARAADQPRPVLSAVVPAPAPTPSAQAFVDEVGAADAFEVAAGRTAAQRAQNPAVKAFAAMMVQDHSRSAEELRTAVEQSGRALRPPGGMDAGRRAELAQLSAASPAAFDRLYVQGQVTAHQAALARLQAYAQDGDAPSLKSHAAQAASTVARHLDEAKQILEQLP
jgi:putative membrane protein